MANKYTVNGLPYWIADHAVCDGHCSPMDIMEAMVFDRPSTMLTLGPRGSGKSHGAAFATHLDSVRMDGHKTKILGGSEAQSKQVYHALGDFRQKLGRFEPIVEFTKEEATYCTGSTVGYVAASPKSVRGPHVPTLRLDEVDEMDSDIRQSAMGMCMDLGARASVTMTSTWHRVGGPMGELLEKGDAGQFPVYRFCVWEVLEHCPDERSGKALEHCPECPLVKWCHADTEFKGQPKAKRANGHYTIDSLIQKVQAVSPQVFESDYLCIGPRAAGAWFTAFDASVHVTTAAEYDPALLTHLSIDCGVWTGAVLFQVSRDRLSVNVFGEYLEYDHGAETSIQEIMARADELCGPAPRRTSVDSTAEAKTSMGRTVMAEYERAGLRGIHGIEKWPKYPGSVAQQLELVDVFLRAADGTVAMRIHPRCTKLITAFRSFSRAKVNGNWTDKPVSECHPHEDIIDPLRGALSIEFPEGRRPEPKLRRVPGRKFF